MQTDRRVAVERPSVGRSDTKDHNRHTSHHIHGRPKYFAQITSGLYFIFGCLAQHEKFRRSMPDPSLSICAPRQSRVLMQSKEDRIVVEVSTSTHEHEIVVLRSRARKLLQKKAVYFLAALAADLVT